MPTMSDVHGTSDRALWCAVIAQALEDATRPLPPVGTGLYRQRQRDRADARAYFGAMTRDFQHVCNLAGLDPDALLTMAQERIRLADAGRSAKRLAPRPKQQRAIIYTHDGMSLPLREWSKRLNVPYGTLMSRISSGWPLSEALSSIKRRPFGTERAKRQIRPQQETRGGISGLRQAFSDRRG